MKLSFSQTIDAKLWSLQIGDPKTYVWAVVWQNQQNDLCAQWILRSAWASTQSDKDLCCLHEEAFDPWLLIICTVKILIRLGICLDWSEFSLGAQVILLCGGSIILRYFCSSLTYFCDTFVAFTIPDLEKKPLQNVVRPQHGALSRVRSFIMLLSYCHS